jgi:hypothetical protein
LCGCPRFCRLEIDGWIGDLSIFRIAYQLQGQSVLKDFVISNFGHGRETVITPKDDLLIGLKYKPKYVLNEKQIDGLRAGLMHQIKQGI